MSLKSGDVILTLVILKIKGVAKSLTENRSIREDTRSFFFNQKLIFWSEKNWHFVLYCSFVREDSDTEENVIVFWSEKTLKVYKKKKIISVKEELCHRRFSQIRK